MEQLQPRLNSFAVSRYIKLYADIFRYTIYECQGLNTYLPFSRYRIYKAFDSFRGLSVRLCSKA